MADTPPPEVASAKSARPALVLMPNSRIFGNPSADSTYANRKLHGSVRQSSFNAQKEKDNFAYDGFFIEIRDICK
jgi:hypothetical protein